MPSDIHIAWGAKIRARRREAGISLDDLASEIGVHRSHLARIEVGEVVPRDDLRPLIAARFGERPEEFFTYDEVSADEVSA